MKKLFLTGTLFLLFGVIGLQAQVNVQINGSHTFLLDESHGIYFHNDSLTVWGVSYSLDQIHVITFQPASGIATIEEANLTLMPNPARETLILQGIGSEPEMVTLYSLSGIKLMELKGADGTVINIGHLPEGVYIMRCGNRVAKVIKQM